MADTIVEQQRRHWDTVAPGWAEWLDWTERNFAPITDWLAKAAEWTQGARVLDVACGAGYPALAAAARVAPDGHVTATDLSAEMIASATRRADALGLRNVDFRQMASERLEYGDATFDSVSNAYGLMFSPDPAEALREAKRVLKPGGRVAVVVWDEFEKSPFFTAITDVARRVLGLATPEPGGPGPFRFARAGAVDEVLHKAGFSRCRTDTVDATFEFVSADEYFQVFRDVAWKSRVDALSPDALAAFRRSVADATRSYDVGGHLRLGASSLCVVAEK